MSGFPEIKAAVDALGETNHAFQKEQRVRLDELKTGQDGLLGRVEELEARGNNPGKTGSRKKDIGPGAFDLMDKQGKRYPALTKGQSLAEYVRSTMSESEGSAADFSLGEHVRGVMLGTKVSSAPALVPTDISAQIVDDVRAATALVRAGAVTIPIDGPTNLLRITADPTVVAHTEGANDVTESEPTFVAVSANPGTLVALVPLSLEVVQDSPNLDAFLRQSIAAAFALKLDTLGIATILADSAIPDSAAAHDPATFAGVCLAVGAAMSANQPLPDACIVNAANFITRHSALASTAGSWLGKPPFLQNMVELPTTSMTVDVSVLGGFQRGVGIAMRADLSLEILRYAKPTHGSHYLIATMRARAIVLQPKALFIQRKVP